MPDIDQLIKNVQEFSHLFGASVPSWLWEVIVIVIAIVIVLSKAISFSVSFLNTVKNGLTQLRNPEERQRRIDRQMFAEHIEDTIRRLGRKGDWTDKRFAELEAEIEAEDRHS